MDRKRIANAMKYCYLLLETARDNLAQEARRKNVDLRRVLGHALLLDTLVAGLSELEAMREECGVQDEAVEGRSSKDHRITTGTSGDSGSGHSNSDSESDSDSDSSDSDSD